MPKNKMTISINLNGLDKKFQDLPDEVSGRMVRTILRTALEPTRKLARYLAPVDTGRMAGGIKIKAGRASGTRITALVQAGNPGHLAESGFSTQSGKQVEGSHFMERALEATEDEFVAAVEEALQDTIAQYFAK